MASEYGAVVLIEGCPLRLTYGRVPTSLDPASDVSLSRLPEPSLAAFDPTTGAITSSRMSLLASANTRARQTWLRTASRPATTTVGTTSAATTGIVVAAPPGPQAIGSYAWLGSEVVRIEGIFGGTITATRGINSDAREHPEGTYLWLGAPYWRRRLVRLQLYRDGAPLAGGEWRGVIDQPPKGSPDGATITLDVAGISTISKDVLINRSAARLRFAGATVRGLGAHPIRSPGVGQLRTVRLGESLAAVAPDGAITRSGLLDTPTVAEQGLTGAELLSAEAYEVVCAGRLFGPLMSFTSGLTHPHHPLRIAATLLGAGAHLSDAWDAGLRQLISTTSLAEIEALIEETSHYEVDHVVLGWSGAPIEVLASVRTMLAYWGLYLIEGADGGLSAVRYQVGTALGAYETLAPVRDLVAWEGARGGAADRMVAEVGTLPFRQGATQQLVLEQGQLSPWESQGETVTVDASTVQLGGAADVLTGRLLSLAYQRLRGQPTLTLRLRGGTPPRIGRLYHLADIVGQLTELYPTALGGMSASLSDDSFMGWCIGARPLVVMATWEVQLRLNNWAIGALLRVRAPSGRVESALDAGPWVQVTLSTVADYGSDMTEPATVFTTGQPVEFWTEDGVPRDDVGVGVILSILSATDVAITGLSDLPSDDNVMRLARGSTPPGDAWVFLDAGDVYE